jgi:hypothetical protein
MDSPEQGGVRINGCEMHCIACDGSPGLGGAGAHSIHGGRFLRPGGGDDPDLDEGRDANGLYVFFRSGDPNVNFYKVTTETRVELANCWQQITDGVSREIFEHDDGSPFTICECGAGEHTCTVANPTGQLFPETLCSCFVYDEATTIGGPFRLFCLSKFSPNTPTKIKINQPGQYNTALIYLGSGESRNAKGNCSANAMVKCAGHIEAGGGVCIAGGTDTFAYVDDAWAQFDWLNITACAMRFKVNTPEDDIRNDVLAYLDDVAHRTEMRLDQVDSKRRGQSAATNFNTDLNRYARGFNRPGATGFPIVPESLPTPRSLVGRFRKSGYTINGDLIIIDVDYRLNFWLHTVNSNPLRRPFETLSRWVNGYMQNAAHCQFTIGIRVDVDAFNLQQLRNGDGTLLQVDGLRSVTTGIDEYAAESPTFLAIGHLHGALQWRIEPFPPEAVETVTIRIFLKADFARPDQIIDVYVGFEIVATIAGGGEPICQDREYTITVPADVFNAALFFDPNGDPHTFAAITFVPTNVLNNVCPGDYLRAELKYVWRRDFTISGPNFPAVLSAVDDIQWYRDGVFVEVPPRVLWLGEQNWTSPAGERPVNAVPAVGGCNALHSSLLFKSYGKASHWLDYEGNRKNGPTGFIQYGGA